MEGLFFRKASDNDIDSIYNNLKLCSENMYKEHGLEHWIPVYPTEKIKEDINSKQVYIVEYNNQIVGNFILTDKMNSLWKTESKAIYLSKLAIVPEYSGKGLGKKCMKYIENLAKNEGYENIRFDVYDKSLNTIAFYKKLGYTVTDTAKTRRFTVLLMEKRV